MHHEAKASNISHLSALKWRAPEESLAWEKCFGRIATFKSPSCRSHGHSLIHFNKSASSQPQPIKDLGSLPCSQPWPIRHLGNLSSVSPSPSDIWGAYHEFWSANDQSAPARPEIWGSLPSVNPGPSEFWGKYH